MTTTPPKPPPHVQAQTQAITAKLRRYADEHKVAFNRVLMLFLLERAAYRLTLEPLLAPALTFKGGFVAVRVYASTRYTTDLDAALDGIERNDATDLAKVAMARDIGDGVWFRLHETSGLTMHGENGGVRLAFRGGLGLPPAKVEKAQIIQIDLSFGADPVTPPAKTVSTPFVIGEGHLSWAVYPIETVIAQKLHALVSRAEGSSRAKDVYDLFIFLPRADPEHLAAALKSTFAHRQTSLATPLGERLRTIDHSVLRLAWSSAVVSAAPTAPSFDDALMKVANQLDAWGL